MHSPVHDVLIGRLEQRKAQPLHRIRQIGCLESAHLDGHGERRLDRGALKLAVALQECKRALKMQTRASRTVTVKRFRIRVRCRPAILREHITMQTRAREQTVKNVEHTS